MGSPKDLNWKSLAWKSAGMVAGAGVTGVSAWLLYSRFLLDHSRPLAKAIDARRCEDEIGGFGLISHYEDTSGAGTPVVLIHSVNAAASAYEMRPLFERLRGRRPVYAPDLPGFGFSSRADIDYAPEFYCDAIASWLAKQVGTGGPVDVVTLSLSSEFAARAALRYPERFRSLSMISPTGFDAHPAGTHPRTAARVRKTLAVPVWSQGFFDALVTSPSIRHYLKKAFHGPVDEGLARYAYDTSHQPGARYAPLHFIAGRMFSPDVHETVYAGLRIPCLVVYEHDEYAGFDRLREFAAVRQNWRTCRIPETASMPQFEKPEETAQVLAQFWASFDAGRLIDGSGI